MIYGIGFDLCSIERIRKLTNKEKFIKKYFSLREQKYILKSGNISDQTVAGMFAAKEAFVKMLGTGFENFDLSALEVLHTEKGMPYFHTDKWAANEIEKRSISRIFLSVSHEQDMAGAYVVAETYSNEIQKEKE